MVRQSWLAAITIHFKKNNIMATNLDKSENTLTEVQSVSFVRGIDGSGNSVRISAANLASVLGGLGITSPIFTTHQDVRARTEKLYSAIAKAGIQVITTRETDVLTFGNSQLFAYQDADGTYYFKLRMLRDSEWSAPIQIVGSIFKGNLSNADDFNTIGEGIYNFSANSIPVHAPSGLSVSGVIECRFLTSNQNVRMQTITASNGNQYVRIRYSSSNTWFDWKQIYS